jgi:hypothetical protein
MRTREWMLFFDDDLNKNFEWGINSCDLGILLATG